MGDWRVWGQNCDAERRDTGQVPSFIICYCHSRVLVLVFKYTKIERRQMSSHHVMQKYDTTEMFAFILDGLV